MGWVIVTALKAAGNGWCSIPVQIRALLLCKEEEGSCVALPAWTLAFLCAMVGTGENLPLDVNGYCWNPFVPQAVAGTTHHWAGSLWLLHLCLL